MRRIVFALLLSIIAPAVALAADDNGGPGACRAFGDTYCSGLQGPDRRACLDRNADKLSESCKTRLTGNEATGATGQSLFAPCRADLQTYCSGRQGDDRYPCLKTNEEKLSPACKQALPGLAGN